MYVNFTIEVVLLHLYSLHKIDSKLFKNTIYIYIQIAISGRYDFIFLKTCHENTNLLNILVFS